MRKLIAITLFLFIISILPGAVHAQPDQLQLGIDEGAEAALGDDQVTDLFGETDILRTITNVLLFFLGAISVIMIIIGGLRYIVSGGDATKVQEAKNTILYAIVGIVVALLSYAVIDFVINAFAGEGAPSL